MDSTLDFWCLWLWTNIRHRPPADLAHSTDISGVFKHGTARTALRKILHSLVEQFFWQTRALSCTLQMLILLPWLLELSKGAHMYPHFLSVFCDSSGISFKKFHLVLRKYKIHYWFYQTAVSFRNKFCWLLSLWKLQDDGGGTTSGTFKFVWVLPPPQQELQIDKVPFHHNLLHISGFNFVAKIVFPNRYSLYQNGGSFLHG